MSIIRRYSTVTQEILKSIFSKRSFTIYSTKAEEVLKEILGNVPLYSTQAQEKIVRVYRGLKFYAPLKKDTVDLIDGVSGTFTNAGTGRSYIDSNDGLLKFAKADTPRFELVDTRRAILLETNDTNYLLYARDLTQAEWVETDTTTALDQIGEDGVADSASSFLATAANATVLQTLVLGAEDYSYTVSIKRITGTGNIEVTDDNGGTWTDIKAHLSTTAWYRHSITRTQANPICGIRIVTDTDKIAVDFNQLEVGKMTTSRILTTVAAVTRTSEASYPYWTLPTGLFDNKGTACLWIRPGYKADEAIATIRGLLAVADSAISLMQLYEDDIYSSDGSGTFATKLTAWSTANTWYKVIVKWGYLDGVQKKFRVGFDTGGGVSWGVEQDFDGSYTLGSYLRLAYSIYCPMHISDIRLDDKVWSDTKINAMGVP